MIKLVSKCRSHVRLVAMMLFVMVGAVPWVVGAVNDEQPVRREKNSGSPVMSDDGRFVAFASASGRLVEGDNNRQSDIFVHDLQTGVITRVSVASDGTEANGYSERLEISGNGRFVVFTSLASNLVANDTNNAQDIFVHDRETGGTTRVSVATGGAEVAGWSDFPAVSDDGRFVAFESSANTLVSGDTNNTTDVFVHDRQTGETARVSVATDGTESNRSNSAAAISGNGRFVTFYSWADNLVSGDTNGVGDIFRHDRDTGETTRVSLANGGGEANNYSDRSAMSSDGRFIAFTSLASNLVNDDTNNTQDVFVRDEQTGTVSRVSVSGSGAQGNAQSVLTGMSNNGRFVTFFSEASNLVAGDTNGISDVFIHNLQTGGTARVSVASSGAEANGSSFQGSVSENGRFVAFSSNASNLVAGDTLQQDVFVRDRETKETRLVSLGDYGVQGNEGSYSGRMSDDGRYVAYVSLASNLVAGDNNGLSDIFVYDAQTGLVICASVSTDGQLGNGESTRLSLSDNGRFVAFVSAASNLVPGDTNNAPDVFVHDVVGRQTTRVSVASDGAEAMGGSGDVLLSGNGRYVFFSSEAGNLVAGDNNFKSDIFIHDRQTGATTLLSLAGSGVVENGGSTLRAVSSDGRFLAFTSYSSNLVAGDTNNTEDAFVYDRQTGVTARVSVATGGAEGNGSSNVMDMSDNGRFVSFTSSASNLVANDTNSSTDGFIHDRDAGTTTRVTVATDGSPNNAFSSGPLLSSDLRFAVFESNATNLVANDTNGYTDIFVRDLQMNQTKRLSGAVNGAEANDNSYVAAVSNNGRFTLFVSLATNLVADDVNEAYDLFLYDQETGETKLISVIDPVLQLTPHLYIPIVRRN